MSLCNTMHERPSLLAIDLRSPVPDVQPLAIDLRSPVPHTRRLRIRRPLLVLPGTRGLSMWNGLICVGHEPARYVSPGLVFLDPRRSFRKVMQAKLPTIPHSICERDGELFFTASREDSVYRVRHRGRWNRWEVSRVWTVPGSSGQTDENHLNAIEVIDGRLCVSGSGRKAPGSMYWSSARHGFVRDIEHEAELMSDLFHPHSLLAVDGDAWTCETRAGRVASRSGREMRLPSRRVLVRGLAADDRFFYVGVSKRRIGSKSLGTFEGYEGSCLVYRVDRETGSPELLVDLSDRADEIYELLLVGDGAG